MSVLLVEKINHRFERITKSRQASGLSVCLEMIASKIEGVTRVQVDNMQHVELAIQRFKPDKVIFQTIWASESDLVRVKALFPKKRFYIHLHSNTPFLAVEGYAIERINEARKHDVGIVFNDERAARAFGGVYLPNIYSVPFKGPRAPKNKSHIDIVCAGSLRPMKNQVTQAVAAIKYADKMGMKLRLHMNIGRSEGGAETLMNLKSLFRANPNHELVSIPWFEHHEFIKYLEDMDMGLQVSLSESFNIVAADYTCAGIPMVVSEEISWASKNVQAKTGCVDSILDKMGNAHLYAEDNRSGLAAFSLNAEKVWNEFVKA